jgi:hypothetical protein
MLLSQTMYANRPGVHVVHVASEMVPIAKVSSIGLFNLGVHSGCMRMHCECEAFMSGRARMLQHSTQFRCSAHAKELPTRA